jgi:hypothetical protein
MVPWQRARCYGRRATGGTDLRASLRRPRPPGLQRLGHLRPGGRALLPLPITCATARLSARAFWDHQGTGLRALIDCPNLQSASVHGTRRASGRPGTRTGRASGSADMLQFDNWPQASPLLADKHLSRGATWTMNTLRVQ